jgi:hypothetical protein
MTSEERIARLETIVAQLVWLHAELSYALKIAIAAEMTNQLSPALRQELSRRLNEKAKQHSRLVVP